MRLSCFVDHIRKKFVKDKKTFCDPRMLTETEYSILCEMSALLPNGHNLFMEYKDLCCLWKKEMDNTVQCVDRVIPTNAKCSYLSSLVWGYLAILLSLSPNSIICSSFFVSIANTTMAITDLAMNSFIHQASILVRALYEMCFTLLAIIIDVEKREAYLELTEIENERKVWHTNFSFKSIEKTINSYVSGILDDKAAIEDWEKWRGNMYHGYSAAVHGNMLQELQELLITNENGESEYAFNLWGKEHAKTYKVIHDMNAILSFTNMIFWRLIADENIDISIDDLVDDEMKINWFHLVQLGNLVTASYFSEVIEAEANAKKENERNEKS